MVPLVRCFCAFLAAGASLTRPLFKHTVPTCPLVQGMTWAQRVCMEKQARVSRLSTLRMSCQLVRVKAFIYYDCDWSDYLSAEPSDANTMDVKAHLLFCHPVHCIRNIGALSNTDCALMESHHIMTKADGSMTSIHTQLLQIMAVQQRR